MKIGIISFWDSQDNYGQLLQCYAVQQLITQLGHEPYHIKYKSQRKSLSTKFAQLLKIFFSGNIISFYKFKKGLVTVKNEYKKDPDFIKPVNRFFDKFRDEYLSLTDNIYSEKDLINNPPIFDVYLCGSDQIWNLPSIPYMLQFGPKSAKRLSIAASMGGVHVTNKYLKSLYKKYLKNFNYISLREKAGTDEIKALGREDAETVLDPTLIFSKEVYQKIALYPEKKDYVFVYLLGNEISFSVDKIFGWAKEKDLDIVYVAAQGRNDDYPKEYPSINEWLGYMYNAKYVITNSFHGMAFSIIFEKPFMVIPLSSNHVRMNDRFTEVLGKFKLNSRLLSGNFDEIFRPIDYISVTKARQKEASKFLKKIDSVLKY